MLVKFLRNTRASDNGTHVRTFTKDRIYEINDDLAQDLVKNGDCEEVSEGSVKQEDVIKTERQEKMLFSAPENRAAEVPNRRSPNDKRK